MVSVAFWCRKGPLQVHNDIFCDLDSTGFDNHVDDDYEDKEQDDDDDDDDIYVEGVKAPFLESVTPGGL